MAEASGIGYRGRMDELLTLITDSLDPAAFLPAALVVLVAGAVRGFAGFGSAMVMAPLLAILYGPPMAVALMVAMEIPAFPQIVRIVATETKVSRVLPLVLPSAVAFPLGALVLVTADPEVLRRAISLIVLALVAAMASGRMPMIPKRRLNDGIAGFTAGLLGGATGLAGPPLILYFLGTGDAARQVRGDLFGYFFFSSLVGLATFIANGLLTLETLIIGLALAAPYMLGMWVGGRIFPYASERAFRRIALLLLTLIGGGTLLG